MKFNFDCNFVKGDEGPGREIDYLTLVVAAVCAGKTFKADEALQ